MQEETGIQTIEEMTAEFSTTEERNFSLINIINDLNRVRCHGAAGVVGGRWCLASSPRLPDVFHPWRWVSGCQEIEAQEVDNSRMRKQAQEAKRTGELTEESRRRLFEVRWWGVHVDWGHVAVWA